MSHPTIIAAMSPVNGATAVEGTEFYFTWACENATAFELWVGESADTMTLAEIVHNKTSSVVMSDLGLESGTTYYWQVIARNGGQWKASPIYNLETV